METGWEFLRSRRVESTKAKSRVTPAKNTNWHSKCFPTLDSPRYLHLLYIYIHIHTSNQFQPRLSRNKIFHKFFSLPSSSPSSFLQTYNTDKQVPDSAGTATAIFSGVKCRYKVIGLDTRSSFNQCDKRIDQASKLTTVADWAQQSGMDTGKRSFGRKRNKKSKQLNTSNRRIARTIDTLKIKAARAQT